MPGRIAVVDGNDRFLRWTDRATIHRERLVHRSIHVLVFDPGGRLLIQRRHADKDTFPRHWDSSCAGHVEESDYSVVRGGASPPHIPPQDAPAEVRALPPRPDQTVDSAGTPAPPCRATSRGCSLRGGPTATPRDDPHPREVLRAVPPSRLADLHGPQLDALYRAVAARELQEELGVTAELEELGHLPPYAGVHYEQLRLFRAVSEGPFTLQPDEVEAIAHVTPDELAARAAAGEAITPTLHHLARWLRKRGLW